MIFKNYRGVAKKLSPSCSFQYFTVQNSKGRGRLNFLSDTLVILGNDASFIDLQMILLPFFHISIYWIELDCGQAVKKAKT